MRYFISFLAGLVILSSCTSITENVIQSTVDARDFREIEEIDVLLLDYQIKKDSSYLTEAEARATQMAGDEVLNKEYRASVLGLLGEIEYLKGNQQGVKNYLDRLRLLSAREEYAFVLASFLVNNPDEKIKALEVGLEQASTTGKIRLNLARLYFSQGEYAKATAFYDEAFSLLPSQYGEYYEEDREMAYQFIYNPPKNIKAADLLAKNQLTVSDVVMLTFLQTNFLDNISVNKNAKPELLFSDLMKAGYFHNKGLTPSSVCKRKNAAYFLLKIIAYLENDSAILTRYSELYLKNAMDSPVPDVNPSLYYFSAVLILVEREIMEVPDGINFFPDNTLSGVEFNEMLDRVREMYF